jgi:RimJ/RimL family protein N-acetyltransferase
MEIHTPRLLLRPVTADDLATTYAYAGNLENTRLMMFLPDADEAETALHLAEAEAQWHLDAPERYEFAVCLAGQHIGGVTLYMQEDRTEAELGWVLHRDHWRRGYVTEATNAVIEFARGMGVRRIFACCDSENVASYRTMLKLGMRLCKDDGVRQNRSMGDEKRVEWTCEMFL